ncbi:Odorant receptor 40, partial [Ephemera danica]
CNNSRYKMELQFILEALKILGIYKDKDSSFIFRLCRYVTIIQFLILHVFVGLQFISATVYIRVNIIYYFLVAATVIGGPLYISRCGKRIRYIIDLLEGDLPGITNYGEMMREEIRMKFRSERYIRRYCIFVFSHTIVTMLIIIGSFVIFRTIATMIGFTSIITNSSQGQSTIPRFLMYVMWWPTNIRELPTYYYIIAWQSFNGVYTIAITNVMNAFTSSLLLAASSRAEMLAKTAKTCLVPLRNNPKRFSKKFRTWLCKHQRYLT